ncbi:L-lactate dehydrogenase (cytochrome) [Albidovulum inexpectatum]|uniref:L-lactate dehydrogenase (Cytochrome) n=1 Tax=Albidovulum inexpectatum TaxID=196587 RepID=A0A2S5JIP6_9RHOB|nr:alpha-hydroxy acid oxidase [Albidovulum inexpectatum]PPB81115.1 L-lactate dehydrogenase (cytochrome) [Albidovulum inexpectatum]
MDLHQRYPAISDLKSRARERIPHFVWEFLDSATGTEATQKRNRRKLDEILFYPSVLHGEIETDLSARLLGREYPLPFGIAPVGMSGLVWPDAERILARAAARAGIPYVLSTVAAQPPEALAPAIGPDGWFQLYPPRDPEIRADLLRRAREAGFAALVFTVDLPAASRRERQVRAGLTQPPRLTPGLLAQVLARPAWALGMTAHVAREGRPRLRTLEKYADSCESRSSTDHIGYRLRVSPDWDYLRAVRDAWRGPLIVKGILRADDARRLEQEGVDAVWVSNHAGRQFDAAPASIKVLPEIRAATDLPILFDSGIESGLDICRALALGADFVMLGRAWHYALGALGADGPAHLVEILARDLRANMGQMGAARLSDLAHRLVR